jgi:predicted dienelactone hydrolase
MMHPRRCAAILSVLVATTVSALSCPPFGDLGNLNVGRRTFQVVDANRDQRELTVDLWYPATTTTTAGETYMLSSYFPFLSFPEGTFVALDNPNVVDGDDSFPLLVFSHGNGGVRTSFISLMEHLASWGFVVAACDHAGNSSNDPPNSDISFQLSDRPRDISLVIDNVLSQFGSELRINEAQVGVLGHSYGGLTTLLVAAGLGQEVPPDGRVKAILPISPSVSDILDLSNVNLPLLVMGGDLDTVTPIDPNNDLVFHETRGVPRWRVDISGAGHNSFSEICVFFDALESVFGEEDAYNLLGGDDLDEGILNVEQSHCDTIEETHWIAKLFSTAFFRATLMDDDEAEECLCRDYVEEEKLPVVFDVVQAANKSSTAVSIRTTSSTILFASLSVYWVGLSLW